MEMNSAASSEKVLPSRLSMLACKQKKGKIVIVTKTLLRLILLETFIIIFRSIANYLCIVYTCSLNTSTFHGAYLFVFLVTTLNNSSSYFLLLPERPSLLKSRVG